MEIIRRELAASAANAAAEVAKAAEAAEKAAATAAGRRQSKKQVPQPAATEKAALAEESVVVPAKAGSS